jgi:hypothetical protein
MKVKFVSRKKMEKNETRLWPNKGYELTSFFIRLLSAVKLRPNFFEIIISFIAFLLVKINMIGSENANTMK